MHCLFGVPILANERRRFESKEKTDFVEERILWRKEGTKIEWKKKHKNILKFLLILKN